MEGEGDHVLSKKKLDELVRQVTGGGQGLEGGQGLAPDVEEVNISFLLTIFCSYLELGIFNMSFWWTETPDKSVPGYCALPSAYLQGNSSRHMPRTT